MKLVIIGFTILSQHQKYWFEAAKISTGMDVLHINLLTRPFNFEFTERTLLITGYKYSAILLITTTLLHDFLT